MTTYDETFRFTGGDAKQIAAYRWDPAKEPVAAVQLVHGMGEHILRYVGVARALTEAGFVVYGHDHRAHGASTNSAAELGQLGPGGWRMLVEDMHRMTMLIHEHHPGLRLGLLAHSMGSFATQRYLPEYSADVDAVVLSGTTLLDQLEAAFDLDKPIDLAVLNAPFVPARTDFDWLSRDEAEVDKYLADPLCGFGLDAHAAKDMFAGARTLVEEQLFARIRDELPVYIAAGEQDPVNGQGALVHLLAERLRDAGLGEVSTHVYPGARHEILNETNREEIIADIVAWLGKTLSPES